MRPVDPYSWCQQDTSGLHKWVVLQHDMFWQSMGCRCACCGLEATVTSQQYDDIEDRRDRYSALRRHWLQS